MAIGTLVAFYPAFHSYRKGGNPLLHLLWPILLYMVLWVSAITFAKLSHFAPIVCALVVANSALSSLLFPLPIAMTMLVIVWLTHRWLIPGLPLGAIWSYGYTDVTTLEWIAAVTIGWSTLISCLTYRYARRSIYLKCKIFELTRNYEREMVLASIHNQANWNRLDPTYNGKILQAIADALKPDADCIVEQKQKLYALSRILLQRAKEERTLTIDPQSLVQVAIDEVLFQSYETIRNLAKPLQLLVRKQTSATHLLTDPTLFERLFTLNFWEICQSEQAIDHIVTLTITDTLLGYHDPSDDPVILNGATDKPSTAPVLPALAFCIATDSAQPDVRSIYHVTDAVFSAYVPKATHHLYQVESRQMVQAHGGYTAITETAERLTCLYVLPLDGKKVMRLKKYHRDDLFQEVTETAESIAQEKELMDLLTQKTTLAQAKVAQAFSFIKQAHGMTTRRSGDPYYTHPMAVTKILLEITKDSTTLLAALLHDTLEDTLVTLDQLELVYGSEIACIVDRVTHYNTQGYRWQLDKSENNRLLDQCKDVRVIQIKLADRLHNLRTLSVRKPIDQVGVAQETLVFYIPWAKKNNITTWIKEMEHICQKILST